MLKLSRTSATTVRISSRMLKMWCGRLVLGGGRMMFMMRSVYSWWFVIGVLLSFSVVIFRSFVWCLVSVSEVSVMWCSCSCFCGCAVVIVEWKCSCDFLVFICLVAWVLRMVCVVVLKCVLVLSFSLEWDLSFCIVVSVDFDLILTWWGLGGMLVFSLGPVGSWWGWGECLVGCLGGWVWD